MRTLLRDRGLANALGFGIGLRLLGLLLDLVQLVELASQYREGQQGEGRTQNDSFHVRTPQPFFGSGQAAFGWMRVSLETVITIREISPIWNSQGRPTWAEVKILPFSE
ncbi:hypothetical protein FQZ97_532020 [compost metagenome]